MQTENIKTTWDYIHWASGKIKKTKTTKKIQIHNTWRMALSLVAYALKIKVNQISKEILNSHLTNSKKKYLINVTNRIIKKNIPIEHITNEFWFNSLKFKVNKYIEMPNIDIAQIIKNKFHPWMKYIDIKSILIINDDSGCIAISCKRELNLLKYIDVTIKSSLKIILNNVQEYGYKDIIKIVDNASINNIENKYNVIIYNINDENDMINICEFIKSTKNKLYDDGVFIINEKKYDKKLKATFLDMHFSMIYNKNINNNIFIIKKYELYGFYHG